MTGLPLTPNEGRLFDKECYGRHDQGADSGYSVTTSNCNSQNDLMRF
jgi:hypothetical protein